MFCKNCGAAIADDARFCMGCGTPVETPAQPAAAAQPAAPAQPATVADPVASIKKIMHFIVAGIATLALIMAIINLFGTYDVSASFMGQSASGPVSDLYETSTMLLLANILYGLFSLAIAGVGVLYFLKGMLKLDLYDKFVGKLVNGLLGKFLSGDGILALIGAVGATAGILQLLMYLIANPSPFEQVSISVSLNWTSWLMLVVYIGTACADIFWIGKKQK